MKKTEETTHRVPGTHDADLTKAALLQSATELFAEHGFAGTTAEMIAKRARVNKAMINYHFRTKDALYEEILNSTMQPFIERIAQLRERQLPPDERLGALIELFGEVHTSRPTFSTMLLREMLSGAAGISDRVAPHFAALVGFVSGTVQEGIQKGVFRPVDPFLTHLSLIASLVFFFATAKARRRLIEKHHLALHDPTPEEYIHHIREAFLHGLTADARKENP